MHPPHTSPLVWADRPLRELLRLAGPMIIQLLSVSMMTFVDTLFIGWLGWVELAAAGLGGMCTFTVLSFGMSVFTAARVEVGHLHGQGDTAGVKRALGAFLRLAAALGPITLGLGLLAAALLPVLADHPQTGQLAAHYAALRSLAFPFGIAGAAIAQWLAAQGDSRLAMRAAVMANIAHIPLNAMLIFGFDFGVQGAAVASAIASVLENGYLLVMQHRYAVALDAGRSTAPGFHWGRARSIDAWRAFVRGLPTGLERVLDMMAFTAIPVLLAQVGPLHVAAHQIVLQLMLLSFLPSLALSDSISVLVSQAMGAQRASLVRQLGRLGLGVGLGYALSCGAVYLLLGRQLLRLFSNDLTLIRLALPALSFGALLQFLNAAYNHYKGMLRGLSVFRYVAWVAVGCAWLATPPLTYFWGVRSGEGVIGAWMALCAEVAVGVVLMVTRTYRHPVFGQRRATSTSASW